MNITEYKEDFGSVTYPTEFEKRLEGLSVEQQMNCFRIANGLYQDVPYAERVYQNWNYCKALPDCEDVRSLIVRNGKIVGAMVKEDYHGRIVPCMVEQDYCCSYAYETDGSGVKESVFFTL